MPLPASHPRRLMAAQSGGAARGARRLGGRLQGFEQRDDGIGRQVLVVVVIDLDHRRVDARAQALDLREGEEPVRRRFPVRDAEVGFHGLFDGVGAAAAELARGL